ncbi:MAG: LysR family transcriptional regulator [Myxococcales bacterium]|nr:LysR family transcriptional regulator [Myxococcales bacterium]
MQRGIAKSRTPIQWDDVRVFLAMARAKSLLGASKALGVDKSTASRRLAALERSLGARLFLRTREGLRLSPLGERLRSNAERAESEIRALEGAGVAGGHEVSGLVRIATTEGMAPSLVANGLLSLRDEHPGLELEVLGANRSVDLRRGEADISIRVAKTEEPELLVRLLARFGISLFASEKYLRVRGRPRSADELAGHDVLVPSAELAGLAEARWLAAYAGVRIAFRSSSMPALIEAALRGHGLVALTRAWGDTIPGLEEAVALEHLGTRPVWLVVHPDVAARPAVRVVADRIAESFRALARGR